MATQVQFRRGTTSQTSGFTGAVGEVTVNTDLNTTVVHDGSTAGGFPLLRSDGTNMQLSAGSLTSCALKFASDPTTGLILGTLLSHNCEVSESLSSMRYTSHIFERYLSLCCQCHTPCILTYLRGV